MLKDFHPFLAKELDAKGQVFGAYGNAGAVKAALRAARDEDWPLPPPRLATAAR